MKGALACGGIHDLPGQAHRRQQGGQEAPGGQALDLIPPLMGQLLPQGQQPDAPLGQQRHRRNGQGQGNHHVPHPQDGGHRQQRHQQGHGAQRRQRRGQGQAAAVTGQDVAVIIAHIVRHRAETATLVQLLMQCIILAVFSG